MTEASLFDDRPCALGEGAFWHPLRGQLFWFDILGRRLMTQTDQGPSDWTLPEMASAAGWISPDALIIATESGLHRFDITSGRLARIAAVEADNPVTRSNDGRADPWGGFWFGTMGKQAEADAGAIYRYNRGEVRRLFAPLRIPNAISFTPDRRFAHFTDTATGIVRRVALDAATGWPAGEAEAWLDLGAEGFNPDGAVCDAEGNLWIAEWGAGRVACHAPDGRFLRAITAAGRHTSCPAFGGADLSTLYITTARQDLPPDVLAGEPLNGCTFAAVSGTTGLPAPQVAI
jgi:sugar lactone lactonase YvrE